MLWTKLFPVCFIEVNSWWNSRAGPEKSVHFKVMSALDCSLWRGFFEFIKNSSGKKFFVRLKEVSALEEVRFLEVPLIYSVWTNVIYTWYS